MHILAIDIGSYSVKYISSNVDRRKVSHQEMSEIVLRDFMADNPEQTLEEAQMLIVQDIIDTIARQDTRIIFQASPQIMTTRFLTLPVKSKKKADLMLPFQLEEDIPYSLSDIHYAYKLEAQKGQHTALVELTKEEIFENYFNHLKERNILPNVLSTETSVVENYFNINPVAGAFCCLDIGHTTTKAYFFYNSRLLATQITYIGGANINEMIAETYKIEMDEAIIYKHQSAFLLNTNQYDQVEAAQREFGVAMDRIFSPLIADFTRWRVGFKVNFGLALQNIFITGGSANIKNIAGYLSEKLEIKATVLDSFEKTESEKVDLNQKSKSKFFLANMMANGFKKKSRFINLLIGDFAQASSTEVPLHSFAFIGTRVVAASLILFVSLFVERFFIEQDIKNVNGKIASVVKTPDLQIPARLRRSAATNPKPVLDALTKKQRSVRQEISTIQAAVEIKALAPLVTVSQIAASSTGATLVDFSVSDTNEIKAVFSSESAEEIKNLKAAFERSSLSDVQTSVDDKALQLTVTAFGN